MYELAVGATQAYCVSETFLVLIVLIVPVLYTVHVAGTSHQ
jgi:hypothetical protein